MLQRNNLTNGLNQKTWYEETGGRFSCLQSKPLNKSIFFSLFFWELIMKSIFLNNVVIKSTWASIKEIVCLLSSLNYRIMILILIVWTCFRSYPWQALFLLFSFFSLVGCGNDEEPEEGE